MSLTGTTPPGGLFAVLLPLSCDMSGTGSLVPMYVLSLNFITQNAGRCQIPCKQAPEMVREEGGRGPCSPMGRGAWDTRISPQPPEALRAVPADLKLLPWLLCPELDARYCFKKKKLDITESKLCLGSFLLPGASAPSAMWHHFWFNPFHLDPPQG